MALNDGQGEWPGVGSRQAVGDGIEPRRWHRVARGQAFGYGGRLLGLDADHADVGPLLFHGDGDAGDQATAADRNEDGPQIRDRVENLEPHRSLAGCYGRVIERMHEMKVAALLLLFETLLPLRDRH